jgi:hypothetical protein
VSGLVKYAQCVALLNEKEDPLQLNGLYTTFVYFPSVSGSSTNLPRSRGTETPQEGRSETQSAFNS